jgi:ferredoxin
MSNLIKTAEELLQERKVNLVIGYEKGSGSKTRPAFIRKAEDAGRLVYDSNQSQNLAVYLLRPEVMKAGKTAFVATIPALRSMLQLASECQIKDHELIAIHVTDNQEIIVFEDFKSIEIFLENADTGFRPDDQELLSRLKSMAVSERFNFWTAEFEKCIKCYACRAACPMCYCQRCTTECNQPQWIAPASHPLGVFEWHLMRAMHLAGRCINCGECATACPVEIPLNMLTYSLMESMEAEFGAKAGMKANTKYALSVYKPEDKESFIL